MVQKRDDLYKALTALNDAKHHTNRVLAFTTDPVCDAIKVALGNLSRAYKVTFAEYTTACNLERKPVVLNPPANVGSPDALRG